MCEKFCTKHRREIENAVGSAGEIQVGNDAAVPISHAVSR